MIYLKKKSLVILLTVLLIISINFLVGCTSTSGNGVSHFNTSPLANCLTYTGYSDRLGAGDIYYYYDKDTNVMYACTNTKAISVLYNADCTLVTYDEWLSNREAK